MFDNLLENFAVYIDGFAFLGVAEEVQLPKITVKTHEWNAASLSGALDIDTGKVEKMESVIKLKGIQTNPMISIGKNNVPLIIRGSLRDKEGNSKKITIEMRGLIKDYDMGTINAESIGETTISLSVNYYRFNLDNNDLIEIDPINNVRSLSGENTLKEVIANIAN